MRWIDGLGLSIFPVYFIYVFLFMILSLSGRSVCRPTRLAGSCHLLLYVCVFTGVTGDFPFSMLVGAARLGWSSDATPGFRFVQLHPVLIVGRRRPKH